MCPHGKLVSANAITGLPGLLLEHGIAKVCLMGCTLQVAIASYGCGVVQPLLKGTPFPESIAI